MDRSGIRPVVRHLHFIFDRPPADDLHTSYPAFLVTPRLGRHLIDAGLTGITMESAQTELDEQYRESHPRAKTPEALLLKVHGGARVDEFGLNEQGQLVVSEVAMKALQRFRLEDCRVYDGDNAPTMDQIADDVWEEARRVAAEIGRMRRKRRSKG